MHKKTRGNKRDCSRSFFSLLLLQSSRVLFIKSTRENNIIRLLGTLTALNSRNAKKGAQCPKCSCCARLSEFRKRSAWCILPWNITLTDSQASITWCIAGRQHHGCNTSLEPESQYVTRFVKQLSGFFFQPRPLLGTHY